MGILWRKLVFQQLSPIHIGKKNYGVISETRLFIPGWTMWGALVNACGKAEDASKERFKVLQSNFEKISCFFPLVEANCSENIPEVKFEKGYLFIDGIFEEELRLKLTDTYVSTAIESQSISAKDESLHETEVFLPRTVFDKDNAKEVRNVFWVGILGVDDSSGIDTFIKSNPEVFVGGDSKYGFGRLKLISYKELKDNEKKRYNISDDGKLKCSKDKALFLDYVQADSSHILINGKTETVINYDFSGSSPEISYYNLCFTPGSELKLGQSQLILKKGVFMPEDGEKEE